LGKSAVRFDAEGNEVAKSVPHIDGEWRVIGWVTSGGYGHFVKASLAQGYIPAELAENENEGLFEIEILGIRHYPRHPNLWAMATCNPVYYGIKHVCVLPHCNEGQCQILLYSIFPNYEHNTLILS